jgi:hypothetical protein
VARTLATTRRTLTAIVAAPNRQAVPEAIQQSLLAAA